MALTITQNPLIELEKAPFTFHETGSRYFGTATFYSDYDFFTDYTEEIVAWLESNNWTLLGDHYYNDPFIKRVYRKENVDVQLVSSAREKQKVQSMLFNARVLCYRRSKAESRIIWITAFHIYQYTKAGTVLASNLG